MPPIRIQPSPSSSQPASPTTSTSTEASGSGPRSTRRKTGCLTCRLRKKKCDEAKPICQLCKRLGLDCLGYGEKRPKWMKEDTSVKEATAAMSNTVLKAKSQRMRAYWEKKAVEDKKDCLDHGLSQQPTINNSLNSSAEPLPPLSVPPTNIPIAPPPHPILPTGYTSAQTTLSMPYSTDPSFALLQANVAVEPSVDLDVDRYVRAFFNLSPPPPMPSQNDLPIIFPAPELPLSTPSNTYSYQPLPPSNVDISYLHHYLSVVIPLQYRFENESITERIVPLAFKHPDVLQSLCALAALHMGASRRNVRTRQRAIGSIPEDPDLAFARSSIRTTIDKLKAMPLDAMASEESAVTAMCTCSFYLFDGGNVKGWKETAELVRRCLAGLLRNACGQGDSYSWLDLANLADRLGHLLSPLVWTDILISVTEGKGSLWLPLYRILLLNNYPADDKTSTLLKETVMGCDSTTRLAMAEVVALSEWKKNMSKIGRLSYRELFERANAIDRLLGERRWREQHLFTTNDPLTVQRRSVSDVFYHGVRVLLASAVNGAFPAVPEVASGVHDTAASLLALDALPAFSEPGTRADRALVMPIVIAGCHTDQPQLQQLFRERFQHLGDAGRTFGNTGSALQLMEAVWRKRAEIADPGVEVCWREVMLEMGEEGLLLI